MAKLTIYGIEHYMNLINDSIFADASFPAPLVKKDVIDNIILKAGEFECLYASPDFMKTAVGIWSNKYQRTFEKWTTAINLEYNPLENYDRNESVSDISTSSGSSESSSTDTEKVSAFDSTNYQNRGQNSMSGSGSAESSGTYSHTSRIHGNIGVTTSQQMLQAEVDVAKLSIIELITDLFISEFAIAIY